MDDNCKINNDDYHRQWQFPRTLESSFPVACREGNLRLVLKLRKHVDRGIWFKGLKEACNNNHLKIVLRLTTGNLHNCGLNGAEIKRCFDSALCGGAVDVAKWMIKRGYATPDDVRDYIMDDALSEIDSSGCGVRMFDWYISFWPADYFLTMDVDQQDSWINLFLKRYEYETTKHVLRKYFNLGIVERKVYEDAVTDYADILDRYGGDNDFDARKVITAPLP